MTLLSKLACVDCSGHLAGALKIGDESLPQKFSNSLFSLVGWSHKPWHVVCKVICRNPRQFTTFGGWSSSIVVSVPMMSTCSISKEVVAMNGLHWCFGTSAFMLDASFTVTDCFLHLLWPCWATRTGPAPGTAFAVDPGVQHLSDIHSYQPMWWACGDYEPCKTSSSSPARCMAVIEGSLIEHQPFPGSQQDGHSLLSVHVISQEMLQILYFPIGDTMDCKALSTGSSHWVATQSVRCRFTCVWVALAWTTASWTCLCISSSVSTTTRSWASCSSCWSHGDSVQDGLHSSHIQPWCNFSSGHLWLHCPIPFGTQC